ncbi:MULTISPECIES: DUF2242 domain-containing protein [unclassified Herbaspirillum]|uniref:DUF2242 domain-containing protein n=1 Tax=unclassified Herbaspirillum TaxID=2624150 RepID=UPI00055238EF|nr:MULTISPECIES: DUF2242 domain-containing protein [unclassified Herbaspirillum]MCI1007527.1 DUF2242 domain-containing protein [Herbaspirillum sp. C7C8]NUT59581.1 DUF2242 domain-containing protein [Herbaspirillum sp. C9C3]
MPRLRFSIPFLVITTATLGLTACTTGKTAFYHQEEFSDTSAFSRSFPGSEKAVCEAARRALLGQGYVISKSSDNTLDGNKSFQPASDKHMEIAFHVVCASNGNGKSSTMFASATQDGYGIKKSNSSASLGVSVLGSVSMPFAASDDSMVRVSSETIRSPDFYDRFFGAAERYLLVDVDDDTAPAKK